MKYDTKIKGMMIYGCLSWFFIKPANNLKTMLIILMIQLRDEVIYEINILN